MAQQIRKGGSTKLVIGGRQAGKSLLGSGAGGSGDTSSRVTVSVDDYNKLVRQASRNAQRVQMLLLQISVDELQRLGLMPADAPDPPEGERPDMTHVLKTLDEQIETFNAAHQRLTKTGGVSGGKITARERKSMTLSQADWPAVMRARLARVSPEEVTKSLTKMGEQIKTVQIKTVDGAK